MKGLIGIAGELESGKSTVAGIICDKFDYAEYSFADNLKQMCIKAFGLTTEQCYTSKGKAEELENKRLLCNHTMMEILMWVNTVNRWEGPIDFDQIHKILHEKHIFSTAREILQFVGTEVCRVCFQDDFHVKVVFDAIRRNKHEKVVISDARFPNERNYIKNAGGFNFKTVDVNAPQSKGTHASETSFRN